MITRVVQSELASVVFLVILGTAGIVCAAQGGRVPSKELVQYIHEAKRRGVAEEKIKSQAIGAGWSEAAVDDAIAYDKTGALPASAVSAKPEPPTLAQVSEPAPAAAPTQPSAAPEKLPEAPGSVPKMAGSSDDYLIGSGDTLQISVWKEPDASVPTVVVRPDGKITMPLIKEIDVAGLTPRQAEAAITERIGKFITDPNVTVVVATINSKKIYLIGAVKKEGTLPYTYGMTVMQALSEAGGLTDYAKRKRIYILRTENGREYRLDFNYEEVIRGERMEQNCVLLPGDTVVVPQ